MILGHREVFSWISSQEITTFIRLSFFHGTNTQMVCCLRYSLIILFSIQVYYRSDMALHFIPLRHIKYIKCNCFSLVFWTSCTITFLCWVHEEVRGNQTLVVVLYFIFISPQLFLCSTAAKKNPSILYTLFSKEEIFVTINYLPWFCDPLRNELTPINSFHLTPSHHVRTRFLEMKDHKFANWVSKICSI